MNTPPAMCPACGAGLHQPATANEAFYECGAYYATVHYGGEKWFRVLHFECRNAFDTAVELRKEIERLKSKLSKWENWQPDDEDLREMKQQAQGKDRTYTDSLAANAIYIGGLEARLRETTEETKDQP